MKTNAEIEREFWRMVSDLSYVIRMSVQFDGKWWRVVVITWVGRDVDCTHRTRHSAMRAAIRAYKQSKGKSR